MWLAELARLLPELLVHKPNIPRPDPLHESWQRQRLLEALSRAIHGVSSPLLLVFDDLQWCDRETLEWLHYHLRFDATARLLVVGTLRPDEVDYRHPLTALITQLRSSDQVHQIELGALTAAETATLAEQVAEHPLASELAQLLYLRTEGNPLFVAETVRASLIVGSASLNASLSAALQASPADLPPKIQAVIHQRLDALSPDARVLAGLAAVIGRSFTLSVLAQASGLDEDTLVRGLDELWQRRIVREQQADAYDFSHDRLREVAYAAVSLTRRRLLHRRVAEALEAVYAADLDAVSAQIAVQAEQAGQAAKAVTYYRRAAAAAQLMYAFEDVIGYLSKAQDLLRSLPATPNRAEQELEICVTLGSAWSSVKTCAAAEAKQAYDRAFQLSVDMELSPHLFHALWGLHEYHLYRADYRDHWRQPNNAYASRRACRILRSCWKPTMPCGVAWPGLTSMRRPSSMRTRVLPYTIGSSTMRSPSTTAPMMSATAP